VSAFRGAPAGADPFRGGTLEWATTSPPPAYNFAVIPYVTSAYPCWDTDDRERDRRRLESGELVLETGHETTATTPVDGRLDEILHMPSESPWPAVLGLVATVGTALVLTDHFLIAAVAVAAAAAVLTLWHAKEPAAA
jgi:cytochrome c oxidase subunit I+III